MIGGTSGEIENQSWSEGDDLRCKPPGDLAFWITDKALARSSPSSDPGEDGNLISMMANSRRNSSTNMASAIPVLTPALA